MIALDLHALGRHPGEQLTRHLTVPAPPDMGVHLIGVPESSPIVMDLTCQSAGDGVLVQGSAAVQLVGQCARCLTGITRDATFAVQELYFYPGRGPSPEETDDDVFFVADDQVDLDPVLREAIVLNLPFSPLCRLDCAGLCPTCGADLNDHPDHATEHGVVSVSPG